MNAAIITCKGAKFEVAAVEVITWRIQLGVLDIVMRFA